MFSTAYAIIFGLLLLSIRWLWKRPSYPCPLPPGPATEPFLGHARILPRKDPQTVFAEWAKKYGDVMCLKVPGKHIIVLSSQAAASDLLDKRSAIYSSRPDFILYKMAGWEKWLTFLPFDDRWHKQRKFTQTVLGRQQVAVEQIEALLIQQAHVLMKNLLTSPKQFIPHFTQFIAAILMEMTYGYAISSTEDPYIKQTMDLTDVVVQMGDSSFYDSMPSLKHLPSWMPGAGTIRKARHANKLTQEIMKVPFQRVQQEMASGTARQSIVSTALEELEDVESASEDDRIMIREASAQIYTAGAETTYSTLQNFTAVMLMFPEVQMKARQEIDSVLGQDRLPDFQDRQSLPYVECVLWETLRWHPTTPMMVPRQTVQDDVYRGMFIPANSTILVNSTAIAYDENTYKDPISFSPERFLPERGEPDPMNLTFGYGRRICPGRHLADMELWLAIACMLSAFEIRPVKDANGKEIPPEIKFTTGLASHPEPFTCQYVPRSKLVEAMIQGL